MSFLDNLENNLKALESQEQGGIDDRNRREAERGEAKAAAPWAERLKNDPWTRDLMQLATRAGYERRVKVNLIWIGTALRLEARGHRLELRPGAMGITAVFLEGIAEVKREPVDLANEPLGLIGEWMGIIDIQKKLDDEKAVHEAEDEQV